MSSPTVTVADPTTPVSTLNGVDVVDNGGVVTIQLTDLSANTWSCTIVGQDDLVTAPTLSTNSTTKTCTFTKPAGPWALLFQSQVNSGIDINGVTQPSLTTTFEIHIKAGGSYRLLASNERAEANSLYGWISKVNAALRLIATSVGANATWQLGTDAAYQIAGTSGPQLVVVPTFTAARTWKMPTAPGDGMPVGIYDKTGQLVNTGNTLSVTTAGGTDHFFVGGVDKGTTYQIDATLFKGGTATFTRRATSSTWELAP